MGAKWNGLKKYSYSYLTHVMTETTTKKGRKDSFRGITASFAEAVKKHPVYKEFYLRHKDKVIVGIRDNSIELYYNCDLISEFRVKGKEVIVEINSYYLGLPQKGKVMIDPIKYDMSSTYCTITEISDKRAKREKQSQERLYIANNSNDLSNWFCIDVEYAHSTKGKKDPWRFDIIAVSKSLPHRVALIELKYGDVAIDGDSGITKHIKDYYNFHCNESYRILRPELISIINGLELMEVVIPDTISKNLNEEDFCEQPEYYFITLNNNPKMKSGSTPKMKMAGYLFGGKTWDSRKTSSKVGTDGFYAVVKDPAFRPFFKFSTAILPDLGIDDIIDSPLYEEGKY